MNAADLNLIDLAPYIADADKARELFEQLRWKDGVVCPHCESTEAYKLTPKADSKKSVRKGVHKCKSCRKQFTVTVKTIFEGSRIPLNKWLSAIYMMSASKKGISAHQLHRKLGITYKSAWFMCHRIRVAMDNGIFAPILEGTVEMDEKYVGGKPRKYDGKERKRGRGTDKTPVVVAVQRDGEARAEKVDNVTKKTLQGLAEKHVQPESDMVTDEFPSYNGLAKKFKSHNTVDHGSGEYARGDVHTNTAESFFSLLQRGYVGTFHHMSDTHLDRYADEFEFRWNNRKATDGERTVKLIEQSGGKRLMYKDLVKTEKNKK